MYSGLPLIAQFGSRMKDEINQTVPPIIGFFKVYLLIAT
jgi:hypothetical protein